jgi:hypothetical protein
MTEPLSKVDSAVQGLDHPPAKEAKAKKDNKKDAKKAPKEPAAPLEVQAVDDLSMHSPF